MKTIFIFLLFFNVILALQAQDRFPAFPFSHTHPISPSLTGVMSADKFRLSLCNFNYRAISPRKGGGFPVDSDELRVYRATFFALDKGFDGKLMTGGWGIRASTENFAGLRQNKVYASFAYEVPFGYKMRYSRLRFGISAGVMQMTLGDEALIFEDQFRQQAFTGNTGENLSDLTAFAADLAASLLFYKTRKIKGNRELNWFGGFSLHHLNRPVLSFFPGDEPGRMNMRSIWMAGGRYLSRKPFDIHALLLMFRQGGQNTFGGQLSARYFLYKEEDFFSQQLFQIGIAVNYIHFQTITPMLTLGFKDKYHLALAYNIMTDRADFLPNVLGGFNIGLNYYFSVGKKQLSAEQTFNYSDTQAEPPFPEF